MKVSDLYGFLPLYKQRGSSSNQEVQFIKRRLRLIKAGHCGTLDPIAEGVLPIVINKATRTMRFFLKYPKSYLFTIQFGIATDSLDITGNIKDISHKVVKKGELEKILPDFVGEQNQLTPDFSARKYKGKKLYQYARNGISVPKPERQIRIDDIKLIDFNYPFAQIEVICSSGTYIRQLIKDICLRLETVGTMYSLIRTSYGIFNSKNTKKREELSLQDIVPITDVFYDFGRFETKESLFTLVCNGSSISIEDTKIINNNESNLYFGFLGDKLIGIYRLSNNTFYPEAILIGQTQ